MLAYAIINFHEITPVIVNKFHSPIQHMAEQGMTCFHPEKTVLFPVICNTAAIPGHTIVITQHDINNVTID